MSDIQKKSKLPLHAAKIEDYALIGDCETAALVSKSGSIDWLCWPSFSSAACFSALLGTADHGFWRIAPTREPKSITRRYLPGTLIVETTFTTPDGVVALIDFMPPRGNNSDVVRILRGVSGKVKMHMDLAVRFDFGRTIPWVTHTDFGLRAIAGMDLVVLRTKVSLKGEEMKTVSDFTIKAGDEIPFTLTYGSAMGKDGNSPTEDPRSFSAFTAFDQTVEFWKEWTARNTFQGEYAEAVERSLITLKALTYKPSGGIVAAPTASLPEKIGGQRNWDYRFCWLRDTSFTLLVLLQAGYAEEAAAWRRWLIRAIAGAPAQIQTIYGICGERQLTEYKADWLPGYENSSPVNIGNAASTQFQLDVFGEVAAALTRTPAAEDDIKVSASAVQAQLIDHLCKIWEEPDDGIWETRGGRKHFTHSKVMAWVALDRSIKHYEQFNGKGDIKRWKKNRDLIHKQVCEKGFNKKLNAFTQSYGSKELDASCLRIGLVGFLPMDDPRIIGTVDAIQKRLMKNGLVERYDTKTSPDGLPPGEGTFLACSFWLVTNLWLIGRHDEARALYDRLLALRNDVGLLSEEYDTIGNRMVGNFPQALSHIALTHAAFAISGAWHPDLPLGSKI
ncbi:glycoside hydrolase family 15 protein [Granulicella tundricola]|uniref:Glycoside hydrolase 15-related protein n=1 Tax=Granulicella tundricola (strain ATCC BAA-1859 / DSM 23138 / MP5ACTX9) TaxID=1198114 RepID=E8WYZ0_GRATM|nr:glycoside hydrolase family 15 protein [Granulicella tundricola]ADW69905.1 glycoside hydrolase 15-related protein [Granulicella tundricola MP5ACTX9]